MPPANFSAREEKEARRLLASDKKADAAALQNWLAMLPAATSLDLLAKIAADMPTRYNRGGVAVGLCIVAMLSCIIGLANRWSLGPAPFTGLFTFFCIEIAFQHNRRLSRKAALLVAYRDDSRAVAPLVKAWDARSAKTAKAIKDSEVLENELARLLTALTEKSNTASVEGPVRYLLSRAFSPLSRRHKGSLPELSELRADLLLAALRYLAHATAGKESPQTRALIARIALYPVHSFAPNRSLVYETATHCLSAEYRPLSALAVEPVAQNVGIWL